MKYSKKFAKVINVNVLDQQIEWDLIGTAAEAQCIWFGLNFLTNHEPSPALFSVRTPAASAEHIAQ